MFELQLCLF